LQTTRRIYELTPYRVLARAVAETLWAMGTTVEEKEIEFIVSESPRPELGDYGIPVARFAKKHGVDFKLFSQSVAERLRKIEHVADVKQVAGYVNIVLDASVISKELFRAVLEDGESFGHLKVDKPLRIVVEHTSANPVHPLHIGHARNAALGDTLARMLRERGHVVQTRFYIDDMGRQVAVLVYGVKLLGGLSIPGNVKPDHWIGLVYALTHTLADIESLKKELEQLKEQGEEEKYRERLRELDELVAAASRLREKAPELFEKLAEAVKGRDPDKDISEIMKSYEFRRDEEIVKLTRGVVEECLKGFKETLARLGIGFDQWDWESDLVWSSLVGRILEEARKSPYATTYKGALALNLQPILDDPVIRQALGVPENYEVPPLILQRSDGTTLYTTRDIAYSIKKFREFNADKVYNVIAAEQRLPQLQIRLALIALGYRREGLNMHHYAYEMVHLPGRRMSGRRGEYVTLDELIDQAVARARAEVEKRSPHLPEEEKQKIAEAVGTAAIRYTLVSVSATKPMTFNIEEALNFEQNSAPYILYTHARAANILAKAAERAISIEWDNIDYNAANENPLRRKLVLQLFNYPYIFAKAADELKPELIVAYLNNLADTFNKWYTSGDSAINEPDPAKRNYKLALVYTAKTVIANALKVLGIKPLERM
jgi:arginyl-tRNA synthetase